MLCSRLEVKAVDMPTTVFLKVITQTSLYTDNDTNPGIDKQEAILNIYWNRKF